MGSCKEIDDGASVSKEEDIFAVKKKNIGIQSNSEEDAASKNKNKGVKNSTNATLPQFTVMEVKVVQGTSDVALVNGLLRVGDRIVVAGLQGPVVTSISALLKPHPVKKLRFKGEYLHHKKIKISQGVKIAALGLEHAIVGASIYVVRPNDDIEASTLASVEALLDFSKAREVNVPVGGMSVGPVHKKDVMRASAMLENNREYAAILALCVEVTPAASQLAHQLGVKNFTSDDIRGLFLPAEDNTLLFKMKQLFKISFNLSPQLEL